MPKLSTLNNVKCLVNTTRAIWQSLKLKKLQIIKFLGNGNVDVQDGSKFCNPANLTLRTGDVTFGFHGGVSYTSKTRTLLNGIQTFYV